MGTARELVGYAGTVVVHTDRRRARRARGVVDLGLCAQRAHADLAGAAMVDLRVRGFMALRQPCKRHVPLPRRQARRGGTGTRDSVAGYAVFASHGRHGAGGRALYLGTCLGC